DATAGVGAFTNAHRDHVSGDLQVLNRLGQGEAIGRYQAKISFDVHERRPVKVLGIDHSAAGVREDLEGSAYAHVIAVAADTKGNNAGADGTLGEWLDLDVTSVLPIR